MKRPKEKHPVVLIIEDDPGHQRLLEICVKRAGCECDCAFDGRSGLQKATKNKYDLIFVDIHIPELDGFVVATDLRENGYTTPLIAITALKFEGLEKKALAVGYNNFLQKPIKPDKIREILSEYVFKGQSAKQASP
jgi:CheY-like chemotaxis protein